MLFSESAVYGVLEGVANRACCSLPSLSGAGLSCSTKQLQRRATGQRVQSCGQELADEETRHIQRWHDGLLRDMSPVFFSKLSDAEGDDAYLQTDGQSVEWTS